MSTLTLLLGDLPIARVTPADADFPTMSGTYELLEHSVVDARLKHVHEFVAMCVRSSALIDADAYGEEAANEEEPFSDLIETEDWALIDAAGRRTAILVPRFAPNGWMYWRLNVDARA